MFNGLRLGTAPSLRANLMNEPERYPERKPQADELNDTESFDPLFFDPVIEVYKRDVDCTLLRENLKLTPQQRSERFLVFMKGLHELREAGRKQFGV